MAEMLFNPRMKDQAVQDGRPVGSWKEVQKAALQFRDEIVAERKARGERTPELIPVVHRRTGEVRWFNFAPNYAGHLNHAEACLRGEWRLASTEEEKAENERIAASQKAAMDAKLAKLAQVQMQGALAALANQQLTNPQGAELAKQTNKTK